MCFAGSGAGSLPPVGEHPGALVHSRGLARCSGAQREEAAAAGAPADEALLALPGHRSTPSPISMLLFHQGCDQNQSRTTAVALLPFVTAAIPTERPQETSPGWVSAWAEALLLGLTRG